MASRSPSLLRPPALIACPARLPAAVLPVMALLMFSNPVPLCGVFLFCLPLNLQAGRFYIM